MLAASAIATKLTISIIQSPPPGGSNLAMADLIATNGTETWQMLGFMLDNPYHMNSFTLNYNAGTACPSAMTKGQVASDEFDIVGTPSIPNSITFKVHPIAGSVDVFTAADYAVNNCSAGVRPSMNLSILYEVPAFKFNIPVATAFSTPPLSSVHLLGKGTLVDSAGASHPWLGTFEYVSAASARDPSPGYYFQIGWWDNPLYSAYAWVLGSPNVFNQVQIYWKDTKTRETINNALIVGGSCPTFVYTLPTSRGTDTITLNVVLGVGNCPHGAFAGSANSAMGGAGSCAGETDR